MIEITKLIEYSELSGFKLSSNEDKLKVSNGTNLPYHLKRMLMTHKNHILQQLGGE